MTTALRASGSYGQVSIPAPSRHWTVTKARLERTSPVIYDPTSLKQAAAGAIAAQLCGTVILVETNEVLVDCTPGMVYFHNLRNVLTYSAGAEATFAQILEGHRVYYDRSSTMPTNVFLSLSPLDKDGNANPLFGYVVLGKGESASDFPKGLSTANSIGVAVMQAASGGI